MAGNSFGKNFVVTTWGESHGPCIGAVVDGCPSGLPLCEDDIQKLLNRRHDDASSAEDTKRHEPDTAKILSGVLNGQTTGTPISILIENTDVHSNDYEALKNIYRPGHADFTWDAKYDFRDYRGGGRSSGRETASRIAAGAVAMKLLNTLNIFIESEVIFNEPETPLSENDSIGGIVKIVVNNMPAGIGEPVFDKLDACLSKALMSIGAVKAVEIGSGTKASAAKGSVNNDPFVISESAKELLNTLPEPERKSALLQLQRKSGTHPVTKITNNAGGVLNGISDGDPIEIFVHFKPVPSISLPQKTINNLGSQETVTVSGRHDRCIAKKGAIACEAMTAITIVDLLFENMHSRLNDIYEFYI